MENPRILIVDDDLDTLRLVGLFLQRHGFQVLAAKTGPHALKQAQEHLPDLILLDIMMPGMDGYEVAQRLRADPNTANIPIIMFTAKGALDDKLAGFEAGADDYITKPVHPSELLARIRRVLTRATGQLSEATLRRARPSWGAHGYLVGVIGAKGGVGASTVSLNVGVALRQKAQANVIVAEMRPGQGSLGLELGLESNTGLANLLKLDLEEITPARVSGELLMFNPGMRLLLASADPQETRFASESDKAERITRHLKALAPFVLADLGPSIQPWTRAILPLCNHIFLVLDGHPTTVRQAKRLIEFMSNQGFGTGRLSLILLNRARSAMQSPWREVQRTLGVALAKVITPAPELAYQAAQNNMPMISQAPNSLTAEQYADLAKYLHEEVVVQA